MPVITRRLCIGTLSALALVLPRSVGAVGIPVVDASRWLTTSKMIQDIIQLTTQISNTLQQVKNAAVGLGRGNLLDDILIAERNLTADLHSISYSMATISTQFHQVFPDREAARHVSPDDASRVRSGWDQELHQSALAASRAQSSLSRIEDNSRAAVALLEASKASVDSDEGSRLAKLQVLVKMLGIINSDLTTLSTTIATTERLNADDAAAQASDQELEAARVDRMTHDYAKEENIPDLRIDILP
jgi:conjugal transfer/entry exclusion protein